MRWFHFGNIPGAGICRPIPRRTCRFASRFCDSFSPLLRRVLVTSHRFAATGAFTARRIQNLRWLRPSSPPGAERAATFTLLSVSPIPPPRPAPQFEHRIHAHARAFLATDSLLSLRIQGSVQFSVPKNTDLVMKGADGLLSFGQTTPPGDHGCDLQPFRHRP